MCSNPITSTDVHGVEITFSCRVCDDCIATRKNDWVARACAEQDTAAHTYVLNLTYRNNPDGTKPISARAFNYRDVQNLFKKIRSHAADHISDDFELRYIVCGERGTQRNRVHWHVIVFASHDIFALGKWTDFHGKPIDAPKPGRMAHWHPFWPHGHLTTDDVNQKTISYVLKYALKDMFNIVKAAGTKRYAKAENHGSSMFRMSKVPPIGWRYIEAKLNRLRDASAVPPSCQIQIPRYSGYWWPRGVVRQNYLKALAEINETHRAENGRDCAQWSTLVASLSENAKDLECLNVGLPETQETPEEIAESILREQRLRTKAYQHAETRRNCGNVSLCAGCYASLNDDQKTDLSNWKDFLRGQYGKDYKRKFRRENRTNPFCNLSEVTEDAFTLGNRLGR